MVQHARLRSMSWQNKLLTWALRCWIKPKSRRGQDIAASRALTGKVPFGAKLAPGWRIRTEATAALKGEWIEPADPSHAARRQRILYLHGGGYVAMSARTHRSITSRLAAWSNASVFALNYRLAPEHRFPAALDDALAAYRTLLATGTPASARRFPYASPSSRSGSHSAVMMSADGNPLRSPASKGEACGWRASSRFRR